MEEGGEGGGGGVLLEGEELGGVVALATAIRRHRWGLEGRGQKVPFGN